MNHLSRSSLRILGLLRSRGKWATVFCIAIACLASLALWGQAQQQNEQLTRELAHLALMNPAAFNAEINKLKTPADFAAEERARLAITKPDEYTARFVTKDAARVAAEANALFSIMNPREAAVAAENQKDSIRRQAEAEALRAIRVPVVSGKN